MFTFFNIQGLKNYQYIYLILNQVQFDQLNIKIFALLEDRCDPYYPQQITPNNCKTKLLPITGIVLNRINNPHNIPIKYYTSILMHLYLATVLTLVLSLHARQFRTATIIATNDIHGVAFPLSLVRSDNNQTYSQGGLSFLAHMIKTVQSQNLGNVLYLDSGDQYQGSIESSPLISNGQTMNSFYNSVALQAWAIGNHQFDEGPTFLNNFIGSKNKETVELTANLKDVDGTTNPLPRQKNSKIYTLNNGLKIGVIGLSTIQTPTSTKGFLDHYFPKYKFLNYPKIVRRQSAKLRKRGANAVLLLCHVGNTCDTDQTFGIWKKNTPQTGTCDPTDEITRMLNELPKGTLDGILQGHRHVFSHHFINDVPVVGTIDRGLYFNILHLKFYKDKLYDQTIEGPIPVCEKIFENTKTCKYLSPEQLKTAGALVDWKFHGETVHSNAQLEQIYKDKWLPMMGNYLEPLLDNEDGQLARQKSELESKLGNLMTNLFHNACPSIDVVILNNGLFRSTWTQGVIQYQHLYNMVPFNDSFMSFDMTGKQLLDTLTTLWASPNLLLYPIYGLKQQVTVDEQYGNRQFIHATLINGSKINKRAVYRVGTTDFQLEGGDDFKDVIDKIYKPRNVNNEGDLRTLLKQQMKKLAIIKPGSLIDPTNPRVTVITNSSNK